MMFATSSLISGVALITQFLCAIFLEPAEFVLISSVFFTLSLCSVVSNFGNDFFVMRTSDTSPTSIISVNFYSIVVYFSVVCALLVSIENKILVVPMTLGLLMQIYAAKLRLTEKLILSSITERFSILVLSSLMIIMSYISGKNVNASLTENQVVGWLTAISVGLFSILMFAIKRRLNIRLQLVTSKNFFKQQLQVFISVVIISSFTFLDKLIVEKYMSTESAGYYFILFYIFSVYRLLGQTIYKYLFTFFRNNKEFSHKYLGAQGALLFVAFQFTASLVVYYLYNLIFDGKYNIHYFDVALVIIGSSFFCIYQISASQIVSRSTHSTLIQINMYSLLSMICASIFVGIGIKYAEINYMLMAFCVFWLGKLISGLLVIKGSEND